jgi:DNA replication protein DnaC
MYEMEPLPSGVRLLSDAESERLRRLHPDLPPSPEQCVTCRGKQQFLWWNEDRSEPVEWKCNCPDQWVLHRFLLNSGIGIWYQRLSWGDVHTEPGVMEAVQSYQEHLEGYIAAGIGLIFHGLKGTGKTLLLTLLLKQMLGMGLDGYFTTFANLTSTFAESTFGDDEEAKVWFQRRIHHAKVLVVDDVGQEFRTQRMVSLAEAEKYGTQPGRAHFSSSVAGAAFDSVLRDRVASARPTFFSTNYTLEELEKAYESNIISLLCECSATYQFTGADYRRITDQRNEEVQQGLTRPLVIG